MPKIAHSSDTPKESLRNTRRTCRRSGSALALHRLARAVNGCSSSLPVARSSSRAGAVLDFMAGESSRLEDLYQKYLI